MRYGKRSILIGVLTAWVAVLTTAPTTSSVAQSASATPTPTPTVAPTPDPVMAYQSVLSGQSRDFQQFLTEQSTKHREFLESYYSKFFGWVGIAVPILAVIVGAIFSGGLTWLLTRINATQLKDAKDAVTANLNQKVDHRVKEESAKIQGKLKTEVDALIKEERAELQKKLDDFQSDIDANKERAKQQVDELEVRTERDFFAVVDYASVIGWAAVVLNFEATTDPQKQAANDRQRQAVIGRMEAVRNKVPGGGGRTFNIFLGRLYRAAGNLKRGIELLTEVMEHYDRANPDHQSDCAAFLYNRACYLTVLAKQSTPGAERQRFFDLAWADLQLVVKLSPADREEAVGDPDFDGLIGSDPSRDSWDRLIALPEPATPAQKLPKPGQP